MNMTKDQMKKLHMILDHVINLYKQDKIVIEADFMTKFKQICLDQNLDVTQIDELIELMK